MEKIKKQYGLWTGIAMVIGIVIGSGVFVKAGKVLNVSGGDLRKSLLAWLVGGLIMVVSAFCFAIFARKVKKFNGAVDYVEMTTSKRIGYHLAWTYTTLYYPIVASIVALIASEYTFKLFGVAVYNKADWQVLVLAFAFITFFVFLNYLAPKISSRFQISATAVKLIPILVIAIAGFLAGVVTNGVGIRDAFLIKSSLEGVTTNFGEAVKMTAFAYEGWVCATAINAELKDSKKNLPIALVAGTIAIVVFYLLYYTGLSSILGNTVNIVEGENAPIVAFQRLFGGIGAIIFIVFIVISCLGTVNGITISCIRGLFTMSCRGLGPNPKKFSKLNKKSGVSFASSMFAYFFMTLLLLIWWLGFNEVLPGGFLNGRLAIFQHLLSMDEIVCALIYLAYIGMYIYIIKDKKEKKFITRYVMPILAIAGSLFFTICGTGIFQAITYTGAETAARFASLIDFGYFMALFVIMVGPSLFFYNKKAKDLIDLERFDKKPTKKTKKA